MMRVKCLAHSTHSIYGGVFSWFKSSSRKRRRRRKSVRTGVTGKKLSLGKEGNLE